MKMKRNNIITKAIGISIASVMIASVLALSSPARPVLATAEDVSCGDTITQSTRLTADIGPCSGDGIIIGADNITLNCNGHTLTGPGSTETFGTGILLADRSGVTIRNCHVTEFSFGFNVTSSNNRLQGNTAARNIGDGFEISGSNNKLQGNRASHNEHVGFFLESADNNKLQGNTAAYNGGSGFLLFFDFLSEGSNNNNLQGNTATHNGGDSFSIWGSNNRLKGNIATHSQFDGFFLSGDSQNNFLIGNKGDNNLKLGYHDESSSDTGTAGTANRYKGNECSGNSDGGSSPTGLCRPQI